MHEGIIAKVAANTRVLHSESMMDGPVKNLKEEGIWGWENATKKELNKR